MTNIKEAVLRQFGDVGAETIDRYLEQIEYTAFWCIRMLLEEENIEAVIPEGVEDVVIVRTSITELHQVKTRSEGQGSWTTADILPILCKQYHNRMAFSNQCCFHFVSDQDADNKTSLGSKSYGPLFMLKNILNIEHDKQPLQSHELTQLDNLKKVILPRILQLLDENHGEVITLSEASTLLHSTWIDTSCEILLQKNMPIWLENALAKLNPMAPSYTLTQLKNIYNRILFLILERIRNTSSLDKRKIEREDILECLTAPAPFEEGFPDLDQVPGRSIMDKKAFLGGFDPTELPVYRKQKLLAENTIRLLSTLNLSSDLDRLIAGLETHQLLCRQRICKDLTSHTTAIGPQILLLVYEKLVPTAKYYMPEVMEIDELFCLGILWRQTDNCSLWWNSLNYTTQKPSS